jgi:hypothetical protein
MDDRVSKATHDASTLRGRSIPLRPSRRVRNDMLYFAAKAPTLPVQRRMALGPLVAARNASRHRPPWTALFLRAYAILAQEIPDLRRVYIGFPRPHLFEVPASVAIVTVERIIGGNPEVFAGRIKDPAARPIRELVEILQTFNQAPLSKIKECRRILIVGRLPLLVRRSLMWLALNMGQRRVNTFGTYALSVYSALGAESLRPLFPCTVVLNYGVIAPDGTADVRLNYDHRVMDGAMVARALQSLETILTKTIVAELADWQ